MKNRYCRNTKLSEKVFVFILSGFLQGKTATATREVILKCGEKVSRPAVEQMFLKIGDYLYRRVAYPLWLKSVREANPGVAGSDEEWETVVLDLLWENLRGTLDYAAYREKGFNYPGADLLIEILRDRWKAFNGLSRKTFRSHVGYATIRHAMLGTGGTPRTTFEYLERRLQNDPL